MSLGDGIALSTALIVIALGIYYFTERQKWTTIGKLFGVAALFFATISVCFWVYEKFESRPKVMTEFSGVFLGMTPEDVTVVRGEPIFRGDGLEHGFFMFAYRINSERYFDDTLFFEPNDLGDLHLTMICDKRFPRIFGIDGDSTQKDLVRRLGTPSNEKIDNDGLEKRVAYDSWNVEFTIRRNYIAEVCIKSFAGLSNIGGEARQ